MYGSEHRQPACLLPHPVLCVDSRREAVRRTRREHEGLLHRTDLQPAEGFDVELREQPGRGELGMEGLRGSERTAHASGMLTGSRIPAARASFRRSGRVAAVGAGAVPFQRQLTLEGVEDHLDPWVTGPDRSAGCRWRAGGPPRRGSSGSASVGRWRNAPPRVPGCVSAQAIVAEPRRGVLRSGRGGCRPATCPPGPDRRPRSWRDGFQPWPLFSARGQTTVCVPLLNSCGGSPLPVCTRAVLPGGTVTSRVTWLPSATQLLEAAP